MIVSSLMALSAMLSFFLLSLRRVDIFTVAYASAVVYFFPAFDPDVQYAAGLYIFYSLFFFLSAIFPYISDSFSRGRAVPLEIFDQKQLRLILLVTLAFCAVTLSIDGVDSFFSYKTESDRRGVAFQYAWSTLVAYLLMMSVGPRYYPGIVFAGVSYIFFFITGDRTQMAVAFLSLVILWSTKERFKMKNLFKLRAGVLWGGVVLMLAVYYGKHIYGSIFDAYAGLGFWDSFVTRLGNSSKMSETLESYHTQGLLDLVVRNNPEISSSYLLDLPFQFLPFFGSETGSTHYFSNALKDLYFSGWSDGAGISSNFWAEGFAFFGWIGVFCFVILYFFILHLLRAFISRAAGIYCYAFCLVGAFWAFYIHRSSIFQLVSHTKRAIYVALFAWVILRVYGALRGKKIKMGIAKL